MEDYIVKVEGDLREPLKVLAAQTRKSIKALISEFIRQGMKNQESK